MRHLLVFLSPLFFVAIANAEQLRVCVLIDQSQSFKEPPLASADFAGLLQHMTEHGGELAVGQIAATADRPLLRLTLPPSPTVPKSPENITNPFARAQGHRDYANQVAAYEQQVQERKESVDFQLEAFRSALSRRLSKPKKAKQTNLSAALRRCRLYFDEAPGRKVLLLYSDGVHDHQELSPSDAGLRFEEMALLINGTGSDKHSLTYLSPLRFESMFSAIRHILRGE